MSVVAALLLAAAAASPEAVVAVVEGTDLNVYARGIDDADRGERLLASEPVGAPRMEPDQLVGIALSPRGDRLAYVVHYGTEGGATGRLVLVDPARRAKQVLAERVWRFSWSGDGTRILYQLHPTPSAPDAGAPLEPASGEWRLVDLATRKHEVIATEADGVGDLADWSGERIVFLKADWYGAPRVLVVFDRRAGTKVERPTDLYRGGKNAHISFSPARARRVAAFDHWDAGPAPGAESRHSCRLYTLTSRLTLERRLAANPDHTCGGLHWNSDHELFYGKATGPEGRISTRSTSPSGYYLLSSVYRYDFHAGSEHAVLKSDGSEVYVLRGLLPGRYLVVSSQDARRTPHHKLELRRLDGSAPIVLRSGPGPVLFVGWLR